MPPGLVAGSEEDCDCRQEKEADAAVDEWLASSMRKRGARRSG
jgi:hypothetical protein